MQNVERDDRGFLRVYSYKGLGAIFYRVFPTTEMLALQDISLSSRLTTKQNESLLEKLISKSISITNKYTNLYNEKVDLNNKDDINHLFKVLGDSLDGSTRKSLYNIQSVLGHRNIGEQSNFMISMVVPEITALTVQDEVFMASQERSTRYVNFNEMYLPKDLSKEVSEGVSKGYDALSSLYNSSFNALSERYKNDFVKNNESYPSADYMKTIIDPTIRDSIRSFLPLGANTSLAMSISARTAENIGRKLLSSENNHNKDAGKLFYAAVSDNVPSLSTHMAPNEYNKMTYQERIFFDYSDMLKDPRITSLNGLSVKLTKGSQTEKQIFESIYRQIPYRMDNKSKKASVLDYLTELASKRGGKYDDLNDNVLRSSFLQSNIVCSLGTARDLWRHRLADRNLSINLNNYILPEVVYNDEKLRDTVKDTFNAVNSHIFELYEREFKSEAELLVPLATKVNLNMSMSLAEALFITENRTTNEAHPEYKKIAFMLYDQLNKSYPHIMDKLNIFLGDRGLLNNSLDYSRVSKPDINKANDDLF